PKLAFTKAFRPPIGLLLPDDVSEPPYPAPALINPPASTHDDPPLMLYSITPPSKFAVLDASKSKACANCTRAPAGSTTAPNSSTAESLLVPGSLPKRWATPLLANSL